MFVVWIIIIVVALLLIYAGIGGYAALTLTKVGDHPQYDQDPGTFGLEYSTVSFPSRGDQLQIAGWYVPHLEASKAIILVHGRNASKQNAITGELPRLAAELHGAGIAVLMIDLRGHGGSEGKRYTFGVYERRDVLGGVDFLLGQGFGAGQIGVLGISLGGAAAIGAAADEPGIGAVVVESTFADINWLIEPNWKAESGLPMFFLPGVFWMWKILVGFELRQVRPVEDLALVPPRPVLIMHSWSDETVDVQHAYALINAVPEAELMVFNDCEHAELFRDDPETYLAALVPFLQDQWVG